MYRLILAVIIFGLFVFSCSTGLFASDNPMYDFYSGLTRIVEENMDNPSACVSRAKSYIKGNIRALETAAEQGRKRARQNMKDYENMSQEELDSAMQKAEEAISDPKVAEAMNKSMEAMNNFMDVISRFSMKHPDSGRKIMDALSRQSFSD